MSPRPKVDRTIRSLRLRTEVDAVLVEVAEHFGISINEAVERAVLLWTQDWATPKSPPLSGRVEVVKQPRHGFPTRDVAP